MNKSLLTIGFPHPVSKDQVEQVTEYLKPVAETLGAALLVLPEDAEVTVHQQANKAMLEVAQEQNKILLRIAEALESVAYGGSRIRTTDQ